MKKTLILLALIAILIYPQNEKTDITYISLDSLLSLPVQSASKFLQNISEAPASITVITSEDIENYGYRTLGELLQFVRSFYISNDKNYSYTGVRGFSRPSDYNNRILLLINGHRLNESIYGSALIGNELGIDLSIIDKVEIVRGPGSVLYGNSAMFAVINIITKKANQLNGINAAAEYGSFQHKKVALNFGKEYDNGLQLNISGNIADLKGEDIYFEEFDTDSTNRAVIHNNKTIGYLYTGYSIAEINKQIRESRYVIALISVCIFLIGSLVIYFISKYPFRTLNDIIKTAKIISSGNMSIRAEETKDEIGEVAKTFNLMMDELEVTDRKLKSWNQHLEVEVKERTIELENEIEERKNTELELIKAKETAEEMNRLKTNFLANMSHEIRTPLVGILGYADIIQSDTEDNDIKEMAGVIKQSGKRLHDTLNQILNLTKVEAEKNNFKLKNTDIIGLINESIDLYRFSAAEKGVELLFNKDAEEVYAEVEQILFINLMNNLLNNAVKYTKKGMITVELKNCNKRIIIEVKDTGVGIPREMLDKIFEPFRQVSEGLDRAFEGTGLGLTLTKKYAEIMNGVIEVDSMVNKGSTFRVILPAFTESTNNENIPAEENSSGYKTYYNEKKVSILLVEDDEVSINIIKIFLKDKYVLDVMQDSKEAIKVINYKEYDIILLDIGLGGADNGIDILRAIRNTQINGNKPVVAVTAYAMPGDEDRFLETGFSHYLAKPFYKQDILELINEILMQPVSN